MRAPDFIGVIEQSPREEIRASIKGGRYAARIDIRAYSALPTSRVFMATRNGLEVDIQSLPLLISLLMEVEAKAHEMGLLFEVSDET